ncbi:MAG: 4-hydroxy-3-methylbut-2-enyl diphosphate reductase [Dehalococcoidia bacterium]|nr:4-hydroxy-3-methylbut-2-enyl diphosphate reductase [Dehalococcoidia bacterium]
MEILQAKEKGFCFGVRRAIELVEKAAEEYGRVETLGAIVHNQQVVDQLHSLGVEVCSDLDGIKGQVVAISSHGVSPGLMNAVEARDAVTVIDTTCPFVRKAQRAAKRLADGGFAVIIFGEPDHPEVRGVLGWGGERAIATTDWTEGLTGLAKAKRLGIISQTTQSLGRFAEFTKQIVDNKLGSLLELRVINTICDATSRRQECALQLAHEVDLMIVVGGKNSANTRYLAQICHSAGVTTYHIETFKDLQTAWFAGRRKVGITAGASTPDSVIDEVVREIAQLGDSLSL